jgi:hypothetical protein
MAARTRKIRHDDETRAKIQTSQIINRLTSHVLGEVDMPASAVTAALGLLRKTIPDLTAVSHSGEIATKPASQMTDDEIAARLAAIGGSRASDDAADAPVDPTQLN